MEEVETLVVGAGPVGLFLAAELYRRGRECMLVERAEASSPHSKALAIMPGTMELFERAGLASAFLGAANRIDGVRFVTPHGRTFVPFCGIPSAFNYVCILPQYRTEALLRARLCELGGRVRFRHELLELHERDRAIEALVRTPEGVRTIRARFVVGCDGVSSTVREAAGIAFAGAPYRGTSLLADALVRTPLPANEACVHVCGGAVVTMFPFDRTLRRIVVVAPREQLPQRASAQWLTERLRAAGYRDTDVREVVWSNAFRVQRRVAAAMRRGNTFLAGDAAHAQSPVGGQGMKLGLRDAWSLAEILAAVASGEGTGTLLDRYERERLAAARRVVARTDALTRALAHPHAAAQFARERIAPLLAGLAPVYGPVIRRLALTA